MEIKIEIGNNLKACIDNLRHDDKKDILYYLTKAIKKIKITK